MSKLAILGGDQAVKMSKPHFKWPRLSAKTKTHVQNQLEETISIYDKSGVIDELESRLSKYFGVKHALLTNSGTAAIHTMYVAANLQPGDEVLCPGYTFHATVTPLFFTGAIPVLVDIDDYGNICSDDLMRKITPRTKAIVITHMWGIPCQMDRLTEIAKKNYLLLLEDGSHAHGATFNSIKVGSFGDLAAFSLQGQKTLTGGEGGVLLTNNDEYLYKSLLLGHYNKRCFQQIPKDHPLACFASTGMGLKFRIHPLAAAIAKEQLEELEGILQGRKKMAKKMAKSINQIPGLKVVMPPDHCESSWYALLIQYSSEALNGLPIDKLHAALLAEGCAELDRPKSTCPLNLLPLFQKPEKLFPVYQGKVKYIPGDLPKAEHFYNSIFKLPVWHLKEEETVFSAYLSAIEKVINSYKEIL